MNKELVMTNIISSRAKHLAQTPLGIECHCTHLTFIPNSRYKLSKHGLCVSVFYLSIFSVNQVIDVMICTHHSHGPHSIGMIRCYDLHASLLFLLNLF